MANELINDIDKELNMLDANAEVKQDVKPEEEDLVWETVDVKPEEDLVWEEVNVPSYTTVDADSGEVYSVPATMDATDTRFAINTQDKGMDKGLFFGKEPIVEPKKSGLFGGKDFNKGMWDKSKEYQDRSWGDVKKDLSETGKTVGQQATKTGKEIVQAPKSFAAGAVDFSGSIYRGLLDRMMGYYDIAEAAEKGYNDNTNDIPRLGLADLFLPRDLIEANALANRTSMAAKDNPELVEQAKETNRKAKELADEWRNDNKKMIEGISYSLLPEEKRGKWNFQNLMYGFGNAGVSIGGLTAITMATKNPIIAAALTAKIYIDSSKSETFQEALAKGESFDEADFHSDILSYIEGLSDVAGNYILMSIGKFGKGNFSKKVSKAIAGSVEKILNNKAVKEPVKKAIKNVARHSSVFVQGAKGFASEGLEEYVPTWLSEEYKNYIGWQDRSEGDIFKDSLWSAFIGGITGAGAASFGTHLYNKRMEKWNKAIKAELKTYNPDISEEDLQNAADLLQESYLQEQVPVIEELSNMLKKEQDLDALPEGIDAKKISDVARNVLKERFGVSDKDIDDWAKIVLPSIDARNQYNEVYQNFYDQLIEQGRKPYLADAESRIIAARATTLAISEGKTVADILNRWKLNIVNGNQETEAVVDSKENVDDIELATEEELKILEKDIQEIKKGVSARAKTKGIRLSGFIKKQGGIKDDRGDIKAMNAPVGVLNKNGISIDDMVMRAWEAGYIQTPERPTINEFLNLLDNDLHGQYVYTAEDAQKEDNREYYRQLVHALDDAGADIDKDSLYEIDRKLKLYKKRLKDFEVKEEVYQPEEDLPFWQRAKDNSLYLKVDEPVDLHPYETLKSEAIKNLQEEYDNIPVWNEEHKAEIEQAEKEFLQKEQEWKQNKKDKITELQKLADNNPNAEYIREAQIPNITVEDLRQGKIKGKINSAKKKWSLEDILTSGHYLSKEVKEYLEGEQPVKTLEAKSDWDITRKGKKIFENTYLGKKDKTPFSNAEIKDGKVSVTSDFIESEPILKEIRAILKKDGWEPYHTSGKRVGSSSSYYEKEGYTLRLSNHELPMTAERQYNTDMGFRRGWDFEYVLDSTRDMLDYYAAATKEDFRKLFYKKSGIAEEYNEKIDYEQRQGDESFYQSSLNKKTKEKKEHIVKNYTDRDNPSRLLHRQEGNMLPEEKKAWDEFFENNPDAERIKANLAKHKGTAWERLAREQVFVRRAIDIILEGKQPNFESALDTVSYGKSVTSDINSIADILRKINVLSGGSGLKTVHSVNSSFLNCNPTTGCAKYCYAASSVLGRNRNWLKPVLIDTLAQHRPDLLAQLIVDQFKVTPLGVAGNKAIRLFDEGDGAPHWMNVIKEINNLGYRVAIFTKRKDFAWDVINHDNKKYGEAFNLVMFSSDASNFNEIETDDKIPVAFVYSDEAEIPMIKKMADNGQVRVILPIKYKGGKGIANETLQALFKEVPEVAPHVCPIDAGFKKIDPRVYVSEGNLKRSDRNSKGWNCAFCDHKGGVGCYHGFSTEKMEKLIKKAKELKKSGEADIITQFQNLFTLIESLKQGDFINDRRYKEAGFDIGKNEQGSGRVLRDVASSETGRLGDMGWLVSILNKRLADVSGAVNRVAEAVVSERGTQGVGELHRSSEGNGGYDTRVRDDGRGFDRSSDGEFRVDESYYQTQAEEKNLVVTHGTTLEKLEEALRLGAMPMPSLAVTKSELATGDQYGEITFVGGYDIINPNKDKANKTFAADIYSPRREKPEYELNSDGIEYIKRQTGNVSKKGDSYWTSNIEYALNNGQDYLLKEVYLASIGKISDLEGGTYSIVQEMTDKQKADFKKWKNKLINEYTDKKIFKGYTPSGNRKYVPYDLKNILQELKQKALRGSEEGMGGTAHALRGVWADELKNIEEIRKRKDKLVDEETYKKLDNIIWDETAKLTDLLVSEKLAEDLANDLVNPEEYMIEEALKLIKPSSDIANILAKADLRSDKKAVDAVKKYMTLLKNTPVKYFESKPARAVDFSEFEGVLIPSDAEYDAVARELEEQGVKQVLRYGSKEEKNQLINRMQKVFFQNPNNPRGKFTRKADTGEAIITLFKTADASTVIHELGHFFLDDMKKFADNPETAEQLQAIYKYVGSKDGTINYDQHEYFARSFEAYVMDGKAPNSLLKQVFDKFSRWLKSVYKTVLNLNVKLDDDIRQVFDQMLGGKRIDFAMQQAGMNMQAKLERGFISNWNINKAMQLLHDGKMSKAEMKELIDNLKKNVLKPGDLVKLLDEYEKRNVKHNERLTEWDYEFFRNQLDNLNFKRDQIKDRILRLINWAKPRTQGAKLVGRFPDKKVNDAFAKFNELITMDKEMASQKLHENMEIIDKHIKGEIADIEQEGKTIEVEDLIFENKLLSFAAGKATNRMLLDIFDTLTETYNTGRLSAKITGEIKKARKERMVNDAIAVLTDNGRVNWREEKSDIRKAINRLGISQESWSGILDILSMNDKSSKTGESLLNQNLDIFAEEQKMHQGINEDAEKISEKMTKALKGTANSAISVDRYMNKDIHEKFEIEWIGNANPDRKGTPQNVLNKKTFTKDQLLDLYMKSKDDETKKIMLDDHIKMYNEEFLQKVDDILTEDDIAITEAIFSFYNENHEKINAFYEDHFGVSLPKNKYYSPRRIERQGVNVETGELRSYAGFSGVKQRTAKGGAVIARGAFNALQEYIVNSNHYMAFSDKLLDINAVAGNVQVKQIIDGLFGERMNKRLKYEISNIASNGKASKNMDAANIWNKVRARYAKAVLGLKPSLAIKQLTSLPAYLEKMSVTDFISGVADFVKNPKQAVQTLSNTTLMKTRDANIIRDLEELSKSDLLKNMQKAKGKIKWNDLLMLNIKLGDRGAIYVGGWAYYKSQLKKNLAKGMSAEEAQQKALQEFERFTDETQQSGRMSQQSYWQSNPMLRAFTMFTSSQNQYLRKELRAMRGLLTKRADKKQVAKTMFIYHLLLPMLFQWASDGFRWDKDAQLRVGVLGSLNGIFLLNGILDNVFDMAVNGANLYNSSMRIRDALPFFAPIEDLIKDIANFDIDDLDAESVLDVIKDFGEVAGIPTKYPLDVAQNMGKYAEEGEYGKELLLWLGWSPYALRDLESE